MISVLKFWMEPALCRLAVIAKLRLRLGFIFGLFSGIDLYLQSVYLKFQRMLKDVLKFGGSSFSAECVSVPDWF